MTVRQLPFVLAFSLTAREVQLDGLVSYLFIRGSPVPPPSAALYVDSSRVRTFSSLFLCEEIKDAYMKK